VIRVAIVDDHPVFRHGLEHAVETAQGQHLAAAAGSVEELERFDLSTVDVVVLDLGLPGLHGDQAVSHLCRQGLIVLVVSAESSRRDVVAAITAGAAGYLTKSSEPAEITRAVEIVAAGDTYVSPTLASYLLQTSRERNSNGGFALTEREREILALVASGERDNEIAAELFISVATVRSHLDRIRDKTGRRRRADLTRLALEDGILGTERREGGVGSN
jgi:DNA-binding NarL/FixJ family response regulator